MVKTKELKIKHYICKICGKVFKTEEDMKKCEAKGVAVKWWENWDSSNRDHVGEELEIGDIFKQRYEGSYGIDNVIVVGFVSKDHRIWLVVESLDDPEPQEMEPENFGESYILDEWEKNSMKWLFKRSDQIKNEMILEMQDEKKCDHCSSIYKDGCSRTLRECLQKQREYVEKIDNGVIR